VLSVISLRSMKGLGRRCRNVVPQSFICSLNVLSIAQNSPTPCVRRVHSKVLLLSSSVCLPACVSYRTCVLIRIAMLNPVLES
jgi:hypothetical protein